MYDEDNACLLGNFSIYINNSELQEEGCNYAEG